MDPNASEWIRMHSFPRLEDGIVYICFVKHVIKWRIRFLLRNIIWEYATFLLFLLFIFPPRTDSNFLGWIKVIFYSLLPHTLIFSFCSIVDPIFEKEILPWKWWRKLAVTNFVGYFPPPNFQWESSMVYLSAQNQGFPLQIFRISDKFR